MNSINRQMVSMNRRKGTYKVVSVLLTVSRESGGLDIQVKENVERINIFV